MAGQRALGAVGLLNFTDGGVAMFEILELSLFVDRLGGCIAVDRLLGHV
ncbi:hypothetical protein [Kribbella sp. NPDC049227]